MKERFLSKVKVNTSLSCWEWCGAKYPIGYGMFWYNGMARPAHRVSYEIHKGRIQDGKHIHHVCENRGCVNPNHLMVVTPQEHAVLSDESITAINLKKTHCLRGHVLAEDNVYSPPKHNNYRQCRTCNILRKITWRRKHRGERYWQ